VIIPSGVQHITHMLVLLPLLVSCQTSSPASSSRFVSGTIPTSLQLPSNVGRLAVLYFDPSNQEEINAYRWLEGAVFQFKEVRPSLRIVERADLAAVMGEQQFQLRGSVSEKTAVRVGRLLGVDSVLIYFIQGPTLRDRMFVKNPENVPPVMVTSKIIRVESAEVLFHNVVTAPIVGQGMGAGAVFSRQSSLRPLVREALERAVTQTISDLTHAFR